MKKILIGVLSFLMVSSLPMAALAASNNYYSRTSMYFLVPGDATFSIAMPADYTSWDAQTDTSEPGAATTDWISFNFTAVPQAALQEPYQVGDSGQAQSGVAEPIMYIDNTGNCDEKFEIKADAALPSNIFVWFNATSAGTPTTGLTALTTSYQTVEAGITTSQFLNMTMYANTSDGVATGETTQDFYLKSTCV